MSPRSPDPWYEVTWDDWHLLWRANIYDRDRFLYGRYFHTKTHAHAWATQETNQLRNTP